MIGTRRNSIGFGSDIQENWNVSISINGTHIFPTAEKPIARKNM